MSSLIVRRLDDRVSAAPQITEADIAEAARLGFRTILNNRPDGEEPGQLDHERAAEVAAAHGLRYLYIPVNAQTMGPAVVDAFAKAVTEEPAPVLAHCRSGTRSTHLWAQAAAKEGWHGVDDIVRLAGSAGYDVTPMVPVLRDLAGR